MKDPRIEQAVEAELHVFWKRIAKRFPEIMTGDIDPMVDHHLTQTVESAVGHWYDVNEKDALHRIEKVVRDHLEDSDYKTTWSINIVGLTYTDRECDDPVELTWDDRANEWDFMSSEDDPIKTADLMRLMTWATEIGASVTAYDNNHHSNVLSITVEDMKVTEVG